MGGGGIVDSFGDEFYEAFRIFKYYDVFNPEMVAPGIYWPYICHILNPIRYDKALSHKAYLPIIFNGFNQPNMMGYNAGGNYFNNKGELISESELIDILKAQEKPFFVKQAVDSMQGKGVTFYPQPKEETETKSDIIDLISKYGEDFVIQEKLIQSEQTRALNPTSLNCFRVTTLLINSKVTTHNVCIKIGGKNAIVDNIGLDVGGILCGVNISGQEIGRLMNVGYDVHFNQHKFTPTGKELSSIKISGFDKVINMALKLHLRVPNCGICGWDIALDENDTPVLIEANLVIPGVYLEQLCAGPVFGERTDEAIEYIKTHKYILNEIYV